MRRRRAPFIFRRAARALARRRFAKLTVGPAAQLPPSPPNRSTGLPRAPSTDVAEDDGEHTNNCQAGAHCSRHRCAGQRRRRRRRRRRGQKGAAFAAPWSLVKVHSGWEQSVSVLTECKWPMGERRPYVTSEEESERGSRTLPPLDDMLHWPPRAQGVRERTGRSAAGTTRGGCLLQTPFCTRAHSSSLARLCP